MTVWKKLCPTSYSQEIKHLNLRASEPLEASSVNPAGYHQVLLFHTDVDQLHTGVRLVGCLGTNLNTDELKNLVIQNFEQEATKCFLYISGTFIRYL